MFFNEDKNYALSNKQALDTYHEVVVSFDYARYNKKINPTGGFAIAFYSALFETPKGGGPDYALGYLPSPKTDYCKLGGYDGMNGAFMAVGFDLNGDFARPGQKYNGSNSLTQNSCSVRLGFEEDYRLVATSKNLLDTRAGILQAQKINNESDIQWNSVRVIISRGFTKITVQMKKEQEKNFYNVLETNVPIKVRDAVRVAITTTVAEDDTHFDLKNFNVAGFPGQPKRDRFGDCIKTFQLGGYSQGEKIVTGDDFIAVPSNGEILIYKLKENDFKVDQVLSDTASLVLLGGSNKFLFARLGESTQFVVYYNNDNKFFRSQDSDLFEDVRDLPDERRIEDKPICAATDDKTLAVGTGKEVVLYNYISNVNQSSIFGTFQYFQSIVEELSGGLPIGAAVQVEDAKLLVGSERGFVNFYLDNGTEFIYEQTIGDPISGNYYSRFGVEMSMQRNDVIIGSPNAFKLRYNTTGQGEAYHYFYGLDRQLGKRRWRKVMNIGNFFLVDTPGGNFGTSVQLKGNNLIISAPYENYLYPSDAFFEDKPNCGRLYVFRKQESGLFSQGVELAPDGPKAEAYSLFGRFVGLFDTYVGVSIAQYTVGAGKPSEVSFFNLDCVFPKPPAHIPMDSPAPGFVVPRFGSIDLVDNSGYMIDMETYTYMQLLCSPSSIYDGKRRG